MKQPRTLLSLLLLFAVTCSALAIGPLRSKTKDTPHKKKVVYAFGFAASFRDTLTFITEIQELDSVKLERQTHFLPLRDLYSYQLKDYLETNLEKTNYTCMIFFNKKLKKLQKQMNKIKTEYSRSGNLNLLETKDFRFTKPQY